MLLDWPVRLLLSPILITQALRVRRMAQSLPEAAGPRSGVAGQGAALRLRIIGDSSAAGVGVATQSEALAGQLVAELAAHHRVHWDLDAVTGATTHNTLARLENAEPQKTDIIVTALGVNDVTRLIPVNLWRRQQANLLTRLHTLYDPRNIYMSGIAPVGQFPLLPNPLRWTLGCQARAYDATQRAAYSNQHGTIRLIPFDQPLDPALMASDGFHPSAEVYTLWAKELASRILPDWPSE